MTSEAVLSLEPKERRLGTAGGFPQLPCSVGVLRDAWSVADKPVALGGVTRSPAEGVRFSLPRAGSVCGASKKVKGGGTGMGLQGSELMSPREAGALADPLQGSLPWRRLLRLPLRCGAVRRPGSEERDSRSSR